MMAAMARLQVSLVGRDSISFAFVEREEFFYSENFRTTHNFCHIYPTECTGDRVLHTYNTKSISQQQSSYNTEEEYVHYILYEVNHFVIHNTEEYVRT